MRDAEEAARVAYLAREAAAWEMLELDDDLLDRAAATIAVGVDPLVAVRNVAEEPQA